MGTRNCFSEGVGSARWNRAASGKAAHWRGGVRTLVFGPILLGICLVLGLAPSLASRTGSMVASGAPWGMGAVVTADRRTNDAAQGGSSACNMGGRISLGGGIMRLRGGKVGGVKAKDLWDKTMEDLGMLEDELRTELMSLRVAQQVGGQPGRVNRIKMVRKSIARVLTVKTAKRRGEVFREVAKDKRKPKDARENRHLPKAMRQRLTKHQMNIKSPRAWRALFTTTWMAGERPMKAIKMEEMTVVEAMLAKTGKSIGALRDELRPKRVYGATTKKRSRFGRGFKTDTGHIPEHAKVAMEKRKKTFEDELARVRAFKERKAG